MLDALTESSLISSSASFCLFILLSPLFFTPPAVACKPPSLFGIVFVFSSSPESVSEKKSHGQEMKILIFLQIKKKKGAISLSFLHIITVSL